ncbi:MAG TPA: NifU N-terminal domain-containing protein [Acidimicrobiales bacterium]|nr:NifU N-terminal domain-containing protein [Acidimicrobiales bacterium]
MDQDAARQLVVEANLAAAAFAHLTDAFTALPFEALGPVKTLLKRYLSTAPWTAEDDDALALAVGPGEGWWHRELDADVSLDFGWSHGRFQVRATTTAEPAGAVAGRPTPELDATFDGPVVPEATPNPRTIRFGFGHAVHDGPSQWYESEAAAGADARVARLFADFDRVANVLVGPDFVAVGLRRPDDWEALLAPVLAAVTDEFADPGEPAGAASPSGSGGGPPWLAQAPPGAARADAGRRLSRLEQAWRDLGSLRPAEAADLAEVAAAASGSDQFHRQVAANLLREADPAAAREHWARLVGDPVRGVRRATVDAMVDANRDDLRPLLESALGDDDAWVRWKALRGLAELGPAPSRAAISATVDDPDFRVRLEAAAALRTATGTPSG